MKIKINHLKRRGCYLFILLLLFSSIKVAMAKNLNNDLFDQIMNECNAKTVEYGVNISFENCDDLEKTCNQIFNSFKFNANKKTVIDKNSYCIEFKNEVIDGYIKGSKNDGNNIVFINIIKKDKFNNLNELKNSIENTISKVKEKSNYKCFTFLKAKLPDDNIELTNNNIINLLKSNNVSKMQTIKIKDGYSTVAYTGRYDICKVANDFFDFNYAVCRYDLYSYLIIGTPEIIIDY